MRAVADATIAARRLASRTSRTAMVGVASALRTVAASITTALRATAASSSDALRATAARLRAASTTIRHRAATVTASLRTVSSSVTVAMRASATTLTTLTTRLRAGSTALAALPTVLGRHLAPILVRAVASLRMVRPPTRAIGAAAAVVVVAAGAVLTLGAADGTSTDAPGAAAPDVSAATTAAAAPVAPVAPIVPPTPAPEPPAPPPAAPEPPPPARRPPVALRIPAIGVEAPTVPVGLEPDGAMEIPADVTTIGWYEPGEGVGVAPGQIGTAVLAGHVDSRTQGAGAFYYLRDLAVGDEVVVEHADGTSSTWRITEIIQYPKDELPIDEVFVWDGPPRLALITCGGAFDWTVRSYTDNLVVHAEPATATDDAPAAVRS